MIFVGRLNNVFAIAGVGLAIIFVNFLMASLFGLNSAMSVLIAVAYGKKDIPNCERILQRGRVICLIATIPLMLIQLFCRSILVSFGVEDEVADYAWQYGIFLFFAIAFHCQFDCYRCFLNSVGQTKVL